MGEYPGRFYKPALLTYSWPTTAPTGIWTRSWDQTKAKFRSGWSGFGIARKKQDRASLFKCGLVGHSPRSLDLPPSSRAKPWTDSGTTCDTKLCKHQTTAAQSSNIV